MGTKPVIDNEYLAGVYDMLPSVIEVTLFPWIDGKASTNGVVVAVAEKRPVEHQDEPIFADVQIEVDRAVFFLWDHSIKWTTTVPRQKIQTRWVVEETNGDRWSIHRASLEMMNTRWRCHCFQNFIKPTS